MKSLFESNSAQVEMIREYEATLQKLKAEPSSGEVAKALEQNSAKLVEERALFEKQREEFEHEKEEMELALANKEKELAEAKASIALEKEQFERKEQNLKSREEQLEMTLDQIQSPDAADSGEPDDSDSSESVSNKLITTLREQVKQLQAEREEQVNVHTTEIEKLKTDLETIHKTELEQVKQSHANALGDAKEKIATHEKMQQETASMHEQKIGQLQQDLTSAQESQKEAESRITNISESARKSANEVISLMKKLEEERSKLSEAEAQLLNEQSQTKELSAKLEQTASNLAKAKARSTARKQKYQQALKSVGEEKQIMLTKLTEKDRQINSLADDLTQQESTMKAQLKKLQHELKGQKTNNEKALTQILTDSKDYEDKTKELTEHISALEETIQKKTKDLHTMRKQNKDQAKQVAGLTAKLTAVQDESAQLKLSTSEQFASLTGKLTSSESHCKEVIAAAETLRTERDQGLADIEKNKVIIANLQTACNASEANEKKLQSEIAQLQSAINVMEREAKNQAFIAETKQKEALQKHEAEVAALRANISALETTARDLREELKQEQEKVLALSEEAELTEQVHEQELNEVNAAKGALEAELNLQLEEVKQDFAKLIAEKDAEMELAIANSTSAQNEVKQLRSKLSDAALEMKAAQRKHQQITKEMKKQVQKLQANAGAGGGHSTPPSAVRRSDQDPSLRRRSQDMVRPSSAITISFMQEENNKLAIQLGTLKSDNHNLGEKVAELQHELRRTRNELSKKTKLLNTEFLNLKKEGRSSAAMDKDKIERAKKEGSFMGSLFRTWKGNENDVLTTEITSKMEAILEDTLLKNIQLKTDISTMGDEITALMAEKKQLERDNARLKRTKK